MQLVRVIGFFAVMAIVVRVLRPMARRRGIERFMTQTVPRILDAKLAKVDPAHRLVVLTQFREMLDKIEKKYAGYAGNGKAKHPEEKEETVVT